MHWAFPGTLSRFFEGRRPKDSCHNRFPTVRPGSDTCMGRRNTHPASIGNDEVCRGEHHSVRGLKSPSARGTTCEQANPFSGADRRAEGKGPDLFCRVRKRDRPSNQRSTWGTQSHYLASWHRLSLILILGRCPCVGLGILLMCAKRENRSHQEPKKELVADVDVQGIRSHLSLQVGAKS